MEYAYLNVFVNALSAMLEFIFNDVMAPILKDVLEVFINFITNIIWNLLSTVLLNLFVTLCTLVDFVESIFNVFAGVSPVLYQGVGEPKARTMSLIDVLFEMEAVTKGFWYITLAAMGICVIFTIYKTAKSISDMALEDKNPVSKVLTDAMKAGITFLMIPFLCVMMLQLSSVITYQASLAFAEVQGGDASIGTILFLSATMDADKATTDEKDLISGVIPMIPGRTPSFDDSVRSKYIRDPDRYKDIDKVTSDFHASNVSYVVGFVSVILILLILILAVIMFVRRMFELLLLYIVSPFFVSTIPMDDGAMFAQWREMFVAKFFSGFGMIFAMKYYLMIVPMISSSNLILYPKNLANGNMINNVLQIFLIIGGAWAVFKSQSLLLQLLNPQAAQAEQQAAALLTGAAMGAANMGLAVATGGSSAAVTGALGAVGAAGSTIGGAAASDAQSRGRDSGSSKPSSSSDSNQAYRG